MSKLGRPLIPLLLSLVGFWPISAPAAQPQAGTTPPTTRSPIATGRTSVSADSDGPVAELQKRIELGQARLQYQPKLGYLPALLEQLRIPPASQLLVFSKTSCQRERISPQTPRALYFNDRSYVAWIPGSPLLEVSCVDPKAGAVFYTLDQKESPRPQLVRRDQCLECHTSSMTLNVPGYVVRSYSTDRDGTIDITNGSSMIDHRTPFAERWGGWYLCGASGLLTPRQLLGSAESPSAKTRPLETRPGDGNLLSEYPSKTSDPVALMVLEHQAHMQNLLTRAWSKGTSASREPAQKAESGPALIEELLRYLLFIDEAALPKPVEPTPEFRTWFEAQGPRDRQGRSLRQFELQGHLFKYPCSYMVYTDAFDALPRSIRLQIYHRLWRILNGEDSAPCFAAIPSPSRRAVLEILLETKADLPVYWKL